jgi:hypothetical protein
MMSKVNYDTLSKSELKDYFLKHRGDQNALQAYLDRLNQQKINIIANTDDPDFDEKVQAAIRHKIQG